MALTQHPPGSLPSEVRFLSSSFCASVNSFEPFLRFSLRLRLRGDPSAFVLLVLASLLPEDALAAEKVCVVTFVRADTRYHAPLPAVTRRSLWKRGSLTRRCRKLSIVVSTYGC